MNTKGALRQILSNLHPNTILKPNLDSNPPPPSPLLDPPPSNAPSPQGASGQQLVGGVVGVQKRGVAPPGYPPYSTVSSYNADTITFVVLANVCLAMVASVEEAGFPLPLPPRPVPSYPSPPAHSPLPQKLPLM